MPIGTLLTVFGLLLGRAATVSTSDVFLLLGFGLHLLFFLTRTTATSEVDAIDENILEI